jgi:hypothetical protein
MSIFNPPSFQPLSSYQQLSGGTSGLPTYEGILESLRTVMRTPAGLSKHELKMRMERSFIDFRREFEVMCLERGLYE